MQLPGEWSRKFVDAEWNFPIECHYVIKILGKMYKYDNGTKKQNMLQYTALFFYIQAGLPEGHSLRTLQPAFDHVIVLYFIKMSRSHCQMSCTGNWAEISRILMALLQLE